MYIKEIIFEYLGGYWLTPIVIYDKELVAITSITIITPHRNRIYFNVDFETHENHKNIKFYENLLPYIPLDNTPTPLTKNKPKLIRFRESIPIYFCYCKIDLNSIRELNANKDLIEHCVRQHDIDEERTQKLNEILKCIKILMKSNEETKQSLFQRLERIDGVVQQNKKRRLDQISFTPPTSPTNIVIPKTEMLVDQSDDLKCNEQFANLDSPRGPFN